MLLYRTHTVLHVCRLVNPKYGFSGVLMDFVRVSLCSIGLPWCWNGPIVTELLSIQILPLVEHRFPTPGLGTHKWRDEAHKLGLLFFLQFAPHTRCDGLDHC